MSRVGGESTRYVWDFERLLQEADGSSGATEQQYLSADRQYGDLVSGYGDGSSKYYEFDALGSTESLLDDTGSVTARFAYRAYGLTTSSGGLSSLAMPAALPSPLGSGGGASEPFAWVGQRGYFRDPELELYLLGAGAGGGTSGRYYEPSTACFLSPDPIGLDGQDPNLYRYVGNDPINGIDPSGQRILVPKDRCLSESTAHPNHPLRTVYGGNIRTESGVRLRNEIQDAFWPWEDQVGIFVLPAFNVAEVNRTEYWEIKPYQHFVPGLWAKINSGQGNGNHQDLARKLINALNLAAKEDRVLYPEGDTALDWRRVPGPTLWQTFSQLVESFGGKIAEVSSTILSAAEAVAQVGLAKFADAAGVDVKVLVKALEQFGGYVQQLVSRGTEIFTTLAAAIDSGLDKFCGEGGGCPDFGKKMLKALGEWVNIPNFTKLVDVAQKFIAGTLPSFAEAAGIIAGIFDLTWDGLLGVISDAIKSVPGAEAAEQGVMLVLGLLEKMEQWLDPTTANAAVGGFAAASSVEPGLGGFLAAALAQVEQFFDQANLDAAIDLPRQLWDAFLNDALKEMVPLVVKFVAELVLAFSPTGAAVIAWVTKAVKFYDNVKEYIDSGKLTATINGLKEVFGDVVGSIDPDIIGQKISDLVQANLPAVFSLLATAVGAGGIEKIPGKVIKKVNWKDPAAKFLAGVTKPVLKRVNNLFGKDKNKKLTTPVKLRNFPDCTGWLAVKPDGKVRVFISCSPEVEQPSDDPSIKDLEDRGDKIKKKAEKVKQSGAKQVEAVELLGEKRQAQEEIEELTPKGQCAGTGSTAGPVYTTYGNKIKAGTTEWASYAKLGQEFRQDKKAEFLKGQHNLGVVVIKFVPDGGTERVPATSFYVGVGDEHAEEIISERLKELYGGKSKRCFTIEELFSERTPCNNCVSILNSLPGSMGLENYVQDKKFKFIWIVQWKEGDKMSGRRLLDEYSKLGLPIV